MQCGLLHSGIYLLLNRARSRNLNGYLIYVYLISQYLHRHMQNAHAEIKR